MNAVELLGSKFLLNYQLSAQKSYKSIVFKNLSPTRGVDDFQRQLKSKLSEINTNIDNL